MKDVEIVVFNDKSWVRFTEYQKLDEELKQEKQSLAKRIYELQSDLSREKSKNEKLCKENEQNIKLYEELKEHCDELELINQKVMEENEQLQEHLNKFSCNEIPNYNCKDCFQDLKQSLDWANERETEWPNRIEELKTDLEYATAIIKDLLNNSHEYAKQNAEDFIKGEKK